MSDEPVSYAVLLRDVRAIEASLLVADVVASVTGDPVSDVGLRVRYGGGFALRSATRDAAEAVAAKLVVEGLPAFVLAEDELALPPRKTKITGATLADDALLAMVGHAAVPRRVPWEAIRCLHAYAIEQRFLEDQPREHMAFSSEGEELDDAAKDQMRRRTLSDEARQVIESMREHEDRFRDRDVRFVIELLVLEPPGILRLDRREFHFAGLGDLLRAHSVDNFIILLRELLRRVPRAVVPVHTTAFAESLDWKRMLLEKEEEVRNFDRWVLQVLLHRPDDARAMAEARTGIAAPAEPATTAPDGEPLPAGDVAPAADPVKTAEPTAAPVGAPAGDAPAQVKTLDGPRPPWPPEYDPEHNPIGRLMLIMTFVGFLVALAIGLWRFYFKALLSGE